MKLTVISSFNSVYTVESRTAATLGTAKKWPLQRMAVIVNVSIK